MEIWKPVSDPFYNSQKMENLLGNGRVFRMLLAFTIATLVRL